MFVTKWAQALKIRTIYPGVSAAHPLVCGKHLICYNSLWVLQSVHCFTSYFNCIFPPHQHTHDLWVDLCFIQVHKLISKINISVSSLCQTFLSRRTPHLPVWLEQRGWIVSWSRRWSQSTFQSALWIKSAGSSSAIFSGKPPTEVNSVLLGHNLHARWATLSRFKINVGAARAATSTCHNFFDSHLVKHFANDSPKYSTTCTCLMIKTEKLEWQWTCQTAKRGKRLGNCAPRRFVHACMQNRSPHRQIHTHFPPHALSDNCMLWVYWGAAAERLT